jgi:hypothetical protein
VTSSSSFLLYALAAGAMLAVCLGFWVRAYFIRRDKSQRDAERQAVQDVISTHARQF